MNIEQIKSLIDDDMSAVDALIQKRLASDVVLVNQLSHYIVNSGGKRLRPQLSLLASRACGYEGDLHYLVMRPVCWLAIFSIPGHLK